MVITSEHALCDLRRTHERQEGGLRAFFLVWRLWILALFSYGLRHSPSMLLTVILCAGMLFMATDTIRVLAARGWK
jgi:hypothetical protein